MFCADEGLLRSMKTLVLLISLANEQKSYDSPLQLDAEAELREKSMLYSYRRRDID